jgi:ComF family protein
MLENSSLSLLRRVKDMRAWLLPSACPLCRAAIVPERDVCEGCERARPGLVDACARCAAALPASGVQPLLCGACQQRPPSFDVVRAPFHYATPLDRLIIGAKYHARFDWAALLGRRMAQSLAPFAREIVLLVPVPLHRQRLRSRGYNQALELARALATPLHLPLVCALERVRATPPQTALSRAERRQNVRRAFALTRAVNGARVALIDDVMTSGATAEAAAECLQRAGAARVEVWVAARA